MKAKLAKKKILKKKAVKKPVKKTVKKTLKKPALKIKAIKKALKKTVPILKEKENLLGRVTHYFPHVQAAVIKLKMPMSVGDKIKVKGHTTDFKQVITSLQIDRVAVESAKKGQEIGFQVESRVRRGDKVTKI